MPWGLFIWFLIVYVLISCTHPQREMGALEAAFEAERQGLLLANKREVEGLLGERKERELGYLRAKQQREERFQREIEAILVQVWLCCVVRVTRESI